MTYWDTRPERTLHSMTQEIRAVNIEKGWRPAAGGPGTNTFGDYIALLHSEVSEALEAYRDHRLADATRSVLDLDATGFPIPAKPEGVGAELADVLIRLLDMADVFGIDLAAEYERKVAYNRTRAFQHGGRTLADGKNLGDQLAEAVPDDPRGWWIGDEVDHIIERWWSLRLPRLTMQDASGDRLTLWTVDAQRAVRMLGYPCHTVTYGDYTIDIEQAEETA